MKNIQIVLNKDKDISNLQHLVNSDYEIKKIFMNLVHDRLYNSQRLYDIYYNESYIGFCAVIKDKKSTFAIDLGIASEHRGKGYSNLVFEHVLNDIKHINGQIVSETLKSNIPGNKMLMNHGFKRYESKKGINKYVLVTPTFNKTK